MLIVVLFLVSCGGGKGDDLDKFIEDAGKDMRTEVEPLPVVKQYVPIEYNADGTLNDPFKPRKALANQSSSLQPDQKRPKEPLEAFPLTSLKYVGSLFQGKIKYALIKTPENTIQQVKIGNYMGQSYGIVTDVTDSAIQLKEIVQDDMTGDWTARNASINLQE